MVTPIEGREPPTQLAEFLLQKRAENRWSRDELADKLGHGVRAKEIALIEEEGDIPPAHVIEALAEFFQMSPVRIALAAHNMLPPEMDTENLGAIPWQERIVDSSGHSSGPEINP